MRESWRSVKRLILIEDKNELIDIFQKYDDIFVLGKVEQMFCLMTTLTELCSVLKY